MESPRSERLARWWLRKPPGRWIPILYVVVGVASLALILQAEGLLEVGFRVLLALVFFAGGLIAFERRQYALIIGRLEAELAELRGQRTAG